MKALTAVGERGSLRSLKIVVQPHFIYKCDVGRFQVLASQADGISTVEQQNSLNCFERQKSYKHFSLMSVTDFSPCILGCNH